MTDTFCVTDGLTDGRKNWVFYIVVGFGQVDCFMLLLMILLIQFYLQPGHIPGLRTLDPSVDFALRVLIRLLTYKLTERQPRTSDV